MTGGDLGKSVEAFAQGRAAMPPTRGGPEAPGSRRGTGSSTGPHRVEAIGHDRNGDPSVPGGEGTRPARREAAQESVSPADRFPAAPGAVRLHGYGGRRDAPGSRPRGGPLHAMPDVRVCAAGDPAGAPGCGADRRPAADLGHRGRAERARLRRPAHSTRARDSANPRTGSRVTNRRECAETTDGPKRPATHGDHGEHPGVHGPRKVHRRPGWRRTFSLRPKPSGSTGGPPWGGPRWGSLPGMAELARTRAA
jgi:hypothetical protein